jgi:hypothetical protein
VRGLRQLLAILTFLSDPCLIECADRLVPPLLRLCPLAPKAVDGIGRLLREIALADRTRVSEITFSNADLFETALTRVSQEGLVAFRLFATSLDAEKFVAICMKHLSDSTLNPNRFAELIGVFIASVGPDTLQRVLDDCLRQLRDATGVVVVNLSRTIASVLNMAPDLRADNLSSLYNLLPIAFETDDAEIRSGIFGLFGNLVNSQICEIVQNALRYKTDRWNYSPESFARSATGLVGLRNLGSTCYMNSIFQQLFHIFPFRYLVLDGQPTEPSQIQLKRLFTELLLSRRRSADTQPFCLCWKGWQNQLVNPRDQQDVFEFWQMVLGQLPPELNRIFQGTIQNSIVGLTNDFTSSNDEPFYAFPLEIKKLKDVEASFQSSLPGELFTWENQYSANGKKIDLRKFARIKTAPPVFVIPLGIV